MNTELQTLQTLFTVFASHTTSVNALWGIFQAVALAFLGLVYGQKDVRRNMWLVLGLSIGFGVFSVSNELAMRRSQKILEAIHKEFHEDQNFLGTVPSPLRSTVEAHTALPANDIDWTHEVFTAAVLVGAWIPLVAGRLRRTG